MRKIHFISEFMQYLPKIDPNVNCESPLIPLVLSSDTLWEYVKAHQLPEDPRDRKVDFRWLDNWSEYSIARFVDDSADPIYAGDLIHISQTISKTKKREHFEVQALIWVMDGKLYWHLPKPSCWGQRNGKEWNFISAEEHAVVVPNNAERVYTILVQFGDSFEVTKTERKLLNKNRIHVQVVKVPIIHKR